MNAYLFRELNRMDEVLCEYAMQLLPMERQLRIARYQHLDSRRQSLAACLLLWYGQREQYGRLWREAWLRNPYGKPYYITGPQFSLSHRGEYIFCAVGEKPVGVDVEKKFPPSMCQMDLFLSKAEKAFLSRSADRGAALASFWSLKEAYGKYCGCGLNYEVEATGFEGWIGSCGWDGHLWHYQSMEGDYSIALCGEEPARIKEVKMKHLKELVDTMKEEGEDGAK
ncbi:MAG: 4'-phosphopantetheinyl transferase superfamily protein [Lachnospiraceae bacterium]|nr:4'-phosphopantetheinyl transferase superfamily protein [Lachnospiraceae bacterium]